MANLFEKPIAANPMSEFVGLPLDFIQKTMDKRQAKFDTAKADIEAAEDSLLGLKFLPGDRERHMAWQGRMEGELDQMIENADGDYSVIQPQLDRWKRKVKRELSYGEIGAQGTAYDAAMAMKGQVDKRVIAGTASQQGADEFTRQMQGHVTSRTEDGGFTSFKGYVPSAITNLTKYLQDNVDEINPKYDDDGNKYIGEDHIASNIANVRQTNPNFNKALLESFNAAKLSGYKGDVNDYASSVITGVISDKEYYAQQAASAASRGANKQGAVLLDIGQPQFTKGDLSYAGGTVPYLKDIAGLFGKDGYKSHNDWVKSKEGIRSIAYMQSKTKDPFPEGNPHAESKWIQENASKATKGKVYTRGATPAQSNMITKQGALRNPRAAVRDTSGRLLSGDEVQAIQGSSKDAEGRIKTSFVSFAVTGGGGYVAGTGVMTSHDGKMYFIEPSAQEVLNDPMYNAGLLMLPSGSSTGKMTITTNVTVGHIPNGTHTVEHVPNTEQFIVYKGDVPTWTMYMENGLPVTNLIPKEE